MAVIERAAWDELFYKRCLDPLTVKEAIQDLIDLTFDADIEITCFRDIPEAERQVLVLLARCIPHAQPANPPPPDAAYWLCTYPGARPY